MDAKHAIQRVDTVLSVSIGECLLFILCIEGQGLYHFTVSDVGDYDGFESVHGCILWLVEAFCFLCINLSAVWRLGQALFSNYFTDKALSPGVLRLIFC